MLTQAEIARLTDDQHAKYMAGDNAYRARFELSMREHFSIIDERARRENNSSNFTSIAIVGMAIVFCLLLYSEFIRNLPAEQIPFELAIYRPISLVGAAYIFPISVVLFIGGAVDSRLREIAASLRDKRRG